MVDSTDAELNMGSGFDEFSERSHRNYAGLNEGQKRNRKTLTDLMTSSGFTIVTTEWWHYDYYDWRNFPLLDIHFDSLKFIAQN